MAFKIQVQDVQKDVAIRKICGVRVDSEEFFALLNEVQKTLMTRGGWFDLQQRFTFCLAGHNIVWPEFVGTILGVRFCQGHVAVTQNGWYSFAGHHRGDRSGGGWGDGAGWGGGYGHHGGVRPRVIIEDTNERPCYGDISSGTGSQIRYYVTNSNDIGKTITLFGKKFGGQPLQEKVNGATVMGLSLTGTNPFSATTDMVTEIQSVVREATEGVAYLYEYNPTCGSLRDIAAFQPSETHPRYRCSRILNVPRGTRDENGCCWTKIEAFVKLKFVELKNERDFVPVDNLRAVKLGIQAIRAEEGENQQLAQDKWADALHELNMESFDKSPDEAIVFENNTFGDTNIGRRRIW